MESFYFTANFFCNNAAFFDDDGTFRPAELAAVLRRLADDLEGEPVEAGCRCPELSAFVFDSGDNRIGEAHLLEKIITFD